MSPKPTIPSERALFATYRLWRKYADPDGLISASEFREMDDDEKREALRELGGAQPAAPDEDGGDDEDEDDDDEPAALADDHADDAEGTGGRFVELTEDLIDPRSTDPFN
jgi:hypothetical protein